MKISFITSSVLFLFLISACQHSMMFEDLLAKADKNHTDEISWEEYLAYHMSKFSDMDVDKNDELSREELAYMNNDMLGRFSKRDNPPKGSPLGFDRIDTDKNGSISKGEFEIFGDRMFKMMDRNSDMLLTEEDLEDSESHASGGVEEGMGSSGGRGSRGGSGSMGGGRSGGMSNKF